MRAPDRRAAVRAAVMRAPDPPALAAGRSARDRRAPERGSVSLFGAAAALVLCLSAIATVDIGAMLAARSRAQSAADAAALAAVVNQAPALAQGEDPTEAARAQADANGATLVRCDCAVGTATADVQVTVTPRLFFLSGWFGRSARATARAELDSDVLTYRASG